MNKSASFFSYLIPAICPAILVAFIAFGAFFSFEISDEGLYLYLLAEGGDSMFMSHFYLLLHPFGSLFKHHIIAYRFLSLTMVTTAAWWFASQTLNFLDWKNQLLPQQRLWIRSMILCGALLTGTFILVPSYHLMSALASYLWVGAIFALASRKKSSKKHLFILGFACFLALASRAPFGLALVSMSLLLLPWMAIKNKRAVMPDVLWAAASAAAAGLFLFIFEAEGAWRSFDVIQRFRSGQGYGYQQQTILNTLLLDLKNLTQHRTIHIILITGTFLTFFKRSKWNFLVPPAFFVAITFLAVRHFDIPWIFLAARLSVFCIALAPLAAFLSPAYSKGLPWVKRAFFAASLSITAAFLSSFGTTADMTQKMGFAMAQGGLIFAILSWPAKKNWNLLQSAYGLLLFVWIGLCVFQGRILDPWRNGPIASMTLYQGDLSRMTGLSLDPKTVDVLNKLNASLIKIQFDRKRDRVIGYEGLPGIMYALKLKSFGSPWYAYEGEYNCAYLPSQNSQGLRHLWFLRFEPLNKITLNCLRDRILNLDLPPQNRIAIGKLNHRSGPQFLYLEGPYLIKHPS